MVVLAMHSTWLIHLSNGPYWNKIIGTEYTNCRRNWWANILYINNYIDNENMVEFRKYLNTFNPN